MYPSLIVAVGCGWCVAPLVVWALLVVGVSCHVWGALVGVGCYLWRLVGGCGGGVMSVVVGWRWRQRVDGWCGVLVVGVVSAVVDSVVVGGGVADGVVVAIVWGCG